MRRIAMTGVVCLVFSACGSNEDPFGNQTGADGAVVSTPDASGPAADAAPSIDAGSLSCAPKPTRLVVLGDSITACSTIGGINGDGCSPKIFHSYLDGSHAAGLDYQNHAVGGAVTDDVPNRQLDRIATGQPGHVLVLIYIGGNDLQPYIFISDGAAESRFETDMPRILNEWTRILDFFDDQTKFPDGVTVMMNTQYNPFDDCTASPYNLSAYKIDLLGQFNNNLRTVADARDNVVLTDQHSPYLGHGHHYNVDSCPHYASGAESWMADLIHPNRAGHANLAAQWADTADRMYQDCQ